MSGYKSLLKIISKTPSTLLFEVFFCFMEGSIQTNVITKMSKLVILKCFKLFVIINFSSLTNEYYIKSFDT